MNNKKQKNKIFSKKGMIIVIDTNNYFDSILNDIRNETELTTESSDYNESVLLNAVLSTGGREISKQVTNQVKYPIDHNAKKIIAKKVKLEMKIMKFQRLCPDNKAEIKDLKKELKEVDKFYNSMKSIAKTSKVRDILSEYESKCRVDYGPRSIYYASIKIPEISKEKKRDEIMESSISDFILENGTAILSNIENLVVEDSTSGTAGSSLSQMANAKPSKESMKSTPVDPSEPPADKIPFKASDAGVKSEETVNSEPTIDENFIANMLPQMGSTEGLGDPTSVTKDVNALNDSIENKTQANADNIEGIELPDDIEIESVYNYINSDTIDYDYTTESSIKAFADKVKTRTVLSAKIRKAAIEKAVLKNKIRISSKLNTDKSSINEMKRRLIDKEKELRLLQKDLTDDETKDLNEFIKVIDKELAEESSKISKDKANSDNSDKKENSNKEEKSKEESPSKKQKKAEDKDKEKIAKIGKEFEKSENKNKQVNESVSTNTTLESWLAELNEQRRENGSMNESTVDDLSPEMQLISVFEAKLDKAMENNDIDAIIAYNNKIKYIKKHMSDLIQEVAVTESLNEAADIDKDMKPIIDVLNQKGYKTKYSSAGHHGLRKKEDEKHDGVYYNKLYSDARIQFAQDYDFPAAPKYWCWKAVEGEKDYLDIIPEPYKDSDGTPDEAFTKWKAKYMGTLKTWVDNLPDKNKSDDGVVVADKKGRMQVQESVDELYENMMTSIHTNYFED